MRNVIIADDEMKVCQLILKLADWDDLGLHVAGIANDGLSALELVEKHRPDILITDIRMPGVDGIELIRRAKELVPALQCIISAATATLTMPITPSATGWRITF